MADEYQDVEPTELGGQLTTVVADPWVLGTPLRRVLLATWFVVVPAVSFWLAPALQPDWQGGEITGRAGLLTDPNIVAARPFEIITSIVFVLVVVAFPDLRRHSLVRVGLVFAAVLAVTYAVLLTVWSDGWSVGITLAGGAAFVAGRWLLSIVRRPRRRTVAAVLGALTIVVLIVAAGFAFLGGPESGVQVALTPVSGILGLAFIYSLAAGPTICAGLIGSILRSSRDLEGPRWWPIAAVGAGVLYVATWRQALQRSLELYNELPTSQPDCYIATAAARGHASIVGSQPGTTPFAINPQLQTFKAVEVLLKNRLPRQHQILRRHYDVIGPPLARRMTHPLAADLAFAVLLPIDLALRLLLRIALPGRGAVVRRIYR